MKERFTVSVHICGKLRNVLQVAFSGNGLLQIVGGAALHSVLVGGVGYDPFFFCYCDMAGIYAEGYTVFFSEVAENCLFRGACGIFTQCPDTAEGVAANKIIGIEFHH